MRADNAIERVHFQGVRELWLAVYRESREVDRESLDVCGNAPFTVRVTFASSPSSAP